MSTGRLVRAARQWEKLPRRALVILPGRCPAHVPTVKAALARNAIGNCHHLEADESTPIAA